MRIVILSSGSKGNSTFVEMGGKRILIDIGINYKNLCAELSRLKISPLSLDGIFITHSHKDHISGLKTLIKNARIPVFAGERTAESLRLDRQYSIDLRSYGKYYRLKTDQIVKLGELSIWPMATSHEVESFGFYLDCGTTNLVYVTDTGFLPLCYGQKLKNKHYYIFESNYDENMLRNCSYPHSIKMRILSRKGHMSNEYSAHCLSNLVGPDTKKMILAHISENSNTEELALRVHRRFMQEGTIDFKNIVCAHQKRALTVVDEFME